MSYHQAGSGRLEHDVCQYGESRLWFRGPMRSLEKSFVACAGGTETFGRFVEQPFAAVLEERLDRRCLNFGSLFCGVDALCDDTELRGLLNQAELCVVQLSDILGQSNRFYRVHPRRNDRFLAPTEDLKSLYPEIDFADVHFVHHLMILLQGRNDARFEVIAEELRRNWIDRIGGLVEALEAPVVLLNLQVLREAESDQPKHGADIRITPQMIEALRPLSAEIVEVTVSVSGQSDELEDMLFGTLQQPMAEYMIGPAAHRSIADALVGPIRNLQ
ncbi:DUF6473 family protein [Ruegeria faecimaris]|nr:DUF6473 family protein [Ruegeria faecimaris]